MEDATTAILDFRDNLNLEVAAQAPDVNSFYGVGSTATAGLHVSFCKPAGSALSLPFLQVFDGHSGSDAANYAKDHLHSFFAGYLQADSLLPTEMHEAMVGHAYTHGRGRFCGVHTCTRHCCKR